ncbi:hypothetical protein QBC37DRAFT_90765 [Rhypophila decipiens]|uniref:Uncharacterized protein n=1 Tax=Rhypophila decipiens TaxID=261697 RepID=A0AAN6YCD8_9PEZI|nr:hypothetical protein QBC37DRAFT_90765 [Rhypophila decipiens]
MTDKPPCCCQFRQFERGVTFSTNLLRRLRAQTFSIGLLESPNSCNDKLNNICIARRSQIDCMVLGVPAGRVGVWWETNCGEADAPSANQKARLHRIPAASSVPCLRIRAGQFLDSKLRGLSAERFETADSEFGEKKMKARISFSCLVLVMVGHLVDFVAHSPGSAHTSRTSAAAPDSLFMSSPIPVINSSWSSKTALQSAHNPACTT